MSPERFDNSLLQSSPPLSQGEMRDDSIFAQLNEYMADHDYTNAIFEIQFILSGITFEEEVHKCYEYLFIVLPNVPSDFDFGSLENNLCHLLKDAIPRLEYKLAVHLARAYARKGDSLHDRKAMFCLGKAVQIATKFMAEELESAHLLACELFERNQKCWTFKTKVYEDALEQLRVTFSPLSKKEVKITPQEVRSIQKRAFENFKVLFNRLLEDALTILGDAPCLYDIRAMGSVGREEPCPYSDLEFMILIQDARHLPYFEKLVDILGLQVAFLAENQEKTFFVFPSAPNIHGFHFDFLWPLKDLIKTPEAMAQYQDLKKVGSKDREDMMLHMILKTISLASNCPSSGLYLEYQRHLETTLSRETRAFQMILDDKRDYLRFWPNGFNLEWNEIDVKEQYVKYLNHLLSSMALFFGVTATNTLDVVDALVEKGIFTEISGLILKQSVVDIYSIRVRLHTSGKGQNEIATCNPINFQLDSSEKFSLEKAFWLVISPLYRCLKDISNIEEFKRTFQKFDLLEKATSPSSAHYQKKLALDLAGHFTEKGGYVQAMHCLSLLEKTKERDQNASKLFLKILPEIHLSEFLKDSLDKTFSTSLAQLEKWESFCTSKDDLKPFNEKLRDIWINISFDKQQQYSSKSKIIEYLRKQLVIKPYATKRYREAYQLFQKSFNGNLTVRELQTEATNQLKGFLDLLLNDIFILLGKAPCGYDIRALGPIAREEIYPNSNLKFFILIEDETKRPYFEHLVTLLQMQIASLETKPYLPHLFCSIPVTLGIHVGEVKPVIISVDTTETLCILSPSTSLCIAENPAPFTQYQAHIQKMINDHRFDSMQPQEREKLAKPVDTETALVQLKHQYVNNLNFLLSEIALYLEIKEVNILDIIEKLVELEIFTQESGVLLRESVKALYAMQLRHQKDELPLAAFEQAEQFALEKSLRLVLKPLYQVFVTLNPENLRASLKNIDLFQIAFEELKATAPEPLIRQIASWLYHRENTTLAIHVDTVEAIAKIKPKSENIYLAEIEKNDKELHAEILKHIYTIHLCYDACKAGNLIKLEEWIKQDKNRLEDQNELGENFLFAAIEGDQWGIFDLICVKAPQLIEHCRKDGWNLMHFAAFHGRVQFFNWLHNAYPQMIEKAVNEMTPLLVAAYHEQTAVLEPFVKMLVAPYDESICRKELTDEQRKEFEKSKKNDLFLQMLVEKPCPQTLRFFFINDLIPSRVYTSRKQTLLHLAATKGHIENIRILHEMGLQLDATDMDKKTALILAVTQGHLPVVEYLLANNARFDLCFEGKTIFHIAAEKGFLDIFHLVSVYPQMKDLVLQEDADGRHPLHEAVRNFDKPEIVKILLDLGADPNAKNIVGFTPLHWAAQYGFIESAKLLLAAGAEVDVLNDFNALPLDLAISWGKDDFVHFFLGVEIDSKNKPGDSFEEKEKFYHDRLLEARETGSYDLQVFYLDQLSGLYVDENFKKKEWKRSATILSGAYAIFEKHVHNALFGKYLIARMERIEGLFLNDKKYKVPALFRHYIIKHRSLLKEVRKKCVADLEKGSHKVEETTQELKNLFQLLLRSLIQDCQELMADKVMLLGGWSCIGLGSTARGEVFPYSNLKFAFLLKNSSDKWRLHFGVLVEFLELRIINLGETPCVSDLFEISPTPSGFSMESKILILTPQDLADFQKRESLEIHLPLLHDLTSVSHISGDPELTKKCQTALGKQLKTTDGYIPLHGTAFYKELSVKLLEPLCSPNANLFILEEGHTSIDIEEKLFRPFHLLLEGLALFYGIHGQPSTLKAIQLLQEQNIISLKARENLEKAFKHLLHLRFETQNVCEANRDTIFHIDVNNIQAPNCCYFDDEKLSKLQEFYQICMPFYRRMKLFFVERKREILQKEVFFEETFLTQGMKFQQAGEEENAKNAFLNALLINPNSLEALQELGAIEEKQRENESALLRYLKVLKIVEVTLGNINPALVVPSYRRVGNMYCTLGNYDLGLKYHELALDALISKHGKGVNREVLDSYQTLSDICIASKNNSKAIHYLRCAFELLCETRNDEEKKELVSKVIAIKVFLEDSLEDLKKIYDLCICHFSRLNELTKQLEKLLNGSSHG